MADRPHSPVVLDQTGAFSAADRQRHHAYGFDVPAGTTEVRIHFWYRSAVRGEAHDLLTLGLAGPAGFRGAAHRWQPRQSVVISAGHASPGFLSGPVEPGRWEVVIDAHEVLGAPRPEPCSFGLLVEVGELAAGQAAPSPAGAWASPGARPGAGWYLGDLHCHTLESDGDSTALAMSRAARRRGLDFLAITDHNTTSWLGPVPGWPANLLRLRGIEVTTFHGHANAWGTAGPIDWRGLDPAIGMGRVLDQVEAMGALISLNHPYAPGNPECTGCRWDFPAHDIDRLSVIEAWNGPWFASDTDNPAALRLWDRLLASRRVTAVAATDAHRTRELRDRRMPFTRVHATGLTEPEVIEGIREGRVVLSSGPRLELAARSAEARRWAPLLPGVLRKDGPLEVRAQVRRLTVDAALWLVADGSIVTSRALGHPRGTAAFTPPPGVRWFRLELRAGATVDGELLALTNPVYLTPR